MSNSNKRRPIKKTVSERVDDWEIEETTVEHILNLLLALMCLCAILCVSFITFTVKENIISIIVIPIVVYIILSAPGMKLRLKEGRSWMLVTDFLAVVNVFVFCMFMNKVFNDEGDYWMYMMIFGFAGILVDSLYLTRYKPMYYLSAPLFMLFNTALIYLWGFGMGYALIIGMLYPIPFLVTTVTHPFYFGIGRVQIKGKYRHYPEPIAKRIRAKQKAEVTEQRREYKERENAAKSERRAKKNKV